MKKFHVLTTALAAAVFLAGCGGNEGGNQQPRVAFKSMVSFGDSLSDVGTYAVGAVAAQGGGHYSINGKGATGLLWINWTEFLSAQLDLAAPCSAETGLNTIQAVVGAPPVPATFHDASTGGACTNYAQGGARVTNPVGPGNALLFNQEDPTSYSNAIGQLTIPVKTQIANYLAHNNNAFTGDQLVTVFAGGNDIFINVAVFKATVGAGGDPTAAGTAAVTAMATAGAEEAAYINSQILANGATHVVVVNLPDVSLTPFAIASGASGQALVKNMTVAFNTALNGGLTPSANLVFVDAFTASEDQATNGLQYGLTNVTTPACTTSSSLTCTGNTLIPAVAPAASGAAATAANTYEYADAVHPTPYGYRLLAQLVGEQLAIKGWL